MFENFRTFETTLAGRPLVIETGKMAQLASGAVMVRYGETSILCTVTASAKPREGVDFFPLSVDYEEKMYSVGKIPGSFFRREGRPSTEAILKEVNLTPSEVVFVLPNNKNIVMAAQQCQGLTEKEVIVIPTATVPQGITAMMNVDTEESEPQVIAQTMLDAASTVTTAQITYAARNSDFDGFAINEGDYLALLNGKLFGTDRDINVLLEKLAELASDQGAEFVTAFYGEGVSEDDANAAIELFSQRCGDAEVSALPGGQPVYYYIISIE